MYLAMVAIGERLCETYGRKLREALFDILDERGAAGAGEEALFGQLRDFGIGHHIRAERGLNDGMEAQLLHAR